MKKALLIILTAALASACCNKPMPRGNWSEAPYNALCKLMTECGREAAEAGGNVNSAVFDYDNTTVLSDIELATMQWQIENLKFKFRPDEVTDLFSPYVPDLDIELKEAGAEGISARMLIEDMAASYRALLDAAGAGCGMEIAPEKLAELRGMPEFDDFKTKFWALYEGDFETFDYREAFFIIAAMFDGFTYPEVQALVAEAVNAQTAKGCVKDVVWESPDMGKAGKVRMVVPDGLALSAEMRNLYAALPRNGVDVYVFSASLEAVVETMACDPAFLGLDTAQVYAIRLRTDSTGLVLREYREGYVRPYKEGKTEAIKALIQSRYDGRGPVLVAGDSEGDYSMLTSFDDMRVGLIVDKGQDTPGIGELRRQAIEAEKTGASCRYVLQRRDNAHAGFARE